MTITGILAVIMDTIAKMFKLAFTDDVACRINNIDWCFFRGMVDEIVLRSLKPLREIMVLEY